MKIRIISTSLTKSLYHLFTIMVAILFVNQIFAQQKLTIELSNGLYKQIPLTGLKLTFDNNGSFSSWQNGVNKNMSFSTVGRIYFTDVSLPTINNLVNAVPDGIMVFPNPSTGKVTIELPSLPDAETMIQVHNLTGQLILNQAIRVKKITLDLTDVKKGVYFIQITDRSFSFQQKVIIK